MYIDLDRSIDVDPRGLHPPAGALGYTHILHTYIEVDVNRFRSIDRCRSERPSPTEGQQGMCMYIYRARERERSKFRSRST